MTNLLPSLEKNCIYVVFQQNSLIYRIYSNNVVALSRDGTQNRLSIAAIQGVTASGLFVLHSIFLSLHINDGASFERLLKKVDAKWICYLQRGFVGAGVLTKSDAIFEYVIAEEAVET